MAFSAVSVIRGPGEIAAMTVEVVKRIFTTRFQTREFLEQAWFITSVTRMPTILVSIPFGAVISLQHARHQVCARLVHDAGRVAEGDVQPRTGVVDGATDVNGDPVRFLDQGNLSIMGGDAWKWLLVGPVAPR